MICSPGHNSSGHSLCGPRELICRQKICRLYDRRASLAFLRCQPVFNGAGNFLYGGNLYGPYDPGLIRLVFLFGFRLRRGGCFPAAQLAPTASVAPTLSRLSCTRRGRQHRRVRHHAPGLVYHGPDFLKGTLCLKIPGRFYFHPCLCGLPRCQQGHFKRRLALPRQQPVLYALRILLMSPRAWKRTSAYGLSASSRSHSLCAQAL